MRIGSPAPTAHEPPQSHVTIELFGELNQAISTEIADLYVSGLSILDIRRQTGKSKTSIRNALLRAGISLRSEAKGTAARNWREPGKRNVRPPYGFCYHMGRVVPEPGEYQNLLLIQRMWKAGMNPNAIATKLNAQKIRPREAKAWSRVSILNIIERFKSKKVILKGDKYELR